MEMKDILEVAEKVTVTGRDRYLINGEIVALQCTTCKEAFQLDNFHKREGGVAGKRPRCKACQIRASQKWKKENKERHLKSLAEWRNSNREFNSAHRHNARAKRYGQIGNLAQADIEILFRKATDKGKFYCMVSGQTITKPTIAHVVPVERAGSTLENLIITSNSVNTLQGSKNLFEFLVSEKGQEVADTETVKLTVYWLCSTNSLTPEELVRKHLNEEDTKRFFEIYN